MCNARTNEQFSVDKTAYETGIIKQAKTNKWISLFEYDIFECESSKLIDNHFPIYVQLFEHSTIHIRMDSMKRIQSDPDLPANHN